MNARRLMGMLWTALGMLCAHDLGAQQVPAVAPDSVPATLYDDGDFVERPGGMLMSTSILWTVFERFSTQAERQEAVDRIDGHAIGGINVVGDGVYFVLIPGDGTLATMDSLRTILLSFPQVILTAPYTVGGVTTN